MARIGVSNDLDECLGIRSAQKGWYFDGLQDVGSDTVTVGVLIHNPIQWSLL